MVLAMGFVCCSANVLADQRFHMIWMMVGFTIGFASGCKTDHSHLIVCVAYNHICDVLAATHG